MSWFFLAIVGHLANGIAFVIDKILLRTAFSRSATYAGLVGILSAVTLFAIPFIRVWPEGGTWILTIVSGTTFVIALWAFFAALARAEASRIVPIVGSLIPILTLVGTYVFLGERLSDKTFLGFGILIVATILLSRGGAGRPTSEAVWLSVTSAFLFAVASITAKATYDSVGFFGGFITTRIAAAVTALFLLVVIDRKAGEEALTILRPSLRATSKHRQPGKLSGILALFGQGLGAVGFLFVQWATAKGSASVVNAMQAVQYALLVLAGLVLAKYAPKLLGENLTRRTILVKSAALAMTALGMYLIV